MHPRRDTANIAGRDITPPGRRAQAEDLPGSPPQPTPRKWLGIHFRCCGVYARIYKNDALQRYEGACPRCHAPLTVPVGQGGTSRRFFEAT